MVFDTDSWDLVARRAVALALADSLVADNVGSCWVDKLALAIVDKLVLLGRN